MNFDVESFKQHIPSYLTADDQQALLQELKKFASGSPVEYFLSSYRDECEAEMLQGDGWRGFELFMFESGERRGVRGVVLSNSCDIDPTNKREIPTRVVFSPLVKLSSYELLLKGSGISTERVKVKIAAIKAQKTSNIFYLPAGGPIEEGYVVRFDDVYNMPFAAHSASKEREKLFTLSMMGFYLFVLKLSVHFCRLQEQVLRKPANPAAASI